MPETVPLVVTVVTGGVLSVIVDGEVEVVQIDFDNLAAGDVSPELTDRVRRMLSKLAPSVLQEVEKYEARYECQNCGHQFWDDQQLDEIQDLTQRVMPGEPMPAGQCPDPDCKALVAVIDKE